MFNSVFLITIMIVCLLIIYFFFSLIITKIYTKKIKDKMKKCEEEFREASEYKYKIEKQSRYENIFDDFYNTYESMGKNIDTLHLVLYLSILAFYLSYCIISSLYWYTLAYFVFAPIQNLIFRWQKLEYLKQVKLELQKEDLKKFINELNKGIFFSDSLLPVYMRMYQEILIKQVILAKIHSQKDTLNLSKIIENLKKKEILSKILEEIKINYNRELISYCIRISKELLNVIEHSILEILFEPLLELTWKEEEIKEEIERIEKEIKEEIERSTREAHIAQQSSKLLREIITKMLQKNADECRRRFNMVQRRLRLILETNETVRMLVSILKDAHIAKQSFRKALDLTLLLPYPKFVIRVG